MNSRWVVSVLPIATIFEYVGCRRKKEGEDSPGEFGGHSVGLYLFSL